MTSISYPCYVDLDPFIDVDWLRSLDGFLTDRIERRLATAGDTKFYTGPFLLDEMNPTVPGSRMIYLSSPQGEDDYYKLDQPDFWQPSGEAEEYAPLMEFIASLPFQATGRMLIMYDPTGAAVSAHRDHDSQDLCHEFVWFRTNLGKPFFMLDAQSGEKLYVSSHSAWFDTVNQYHGADATGRMSISIRVDGIFTDQFRSQIPFPSDNRAAAPALWAATR